MKPNKINCKKNMIKSVISFLSIVVVLSRNVYANISSSKLVTGTTKLFNDISSTLLIFVPIICGICGIAFGIGLAMADEQDKKTWKNRLKWLFIGFIIAMTITGIITAIGTYYR